MSNWGGSNVHYSLGKNRFVRRRVRTSTAVIMKCATGKLLEMVQSGNNGRVPLLQEEEHHYGEREVGDPRSRDVTGDVVSSGPAAHCEHQETHAGIQLSIQVQQFCALYCHPVEANGTVSRETTFFMMCVSQMVVFTLSEPSLIV